jgi:hypothetical protein
VTNSSAGSGARPSIRPSRPATHSSSGPGPGPCPYPSACQPYLRSAASTAAAQSAGSSVGAGWPQPRSIVGPSPGYWAIGSPGWGGSVFR